jgi:hypothetical protein
VIDLDIVMCAGESQPGGGFQATAAGIIHPPHQRLEINRRHDRSCPTRFD